MPHTLLQLIDIKQNTGSAAGHREIADRRQEAAKRGWAKQKGLVKVNESVGEGICKVRQVQANAIVSKVGAKPRTDSR